VRNVGVIAHIDAGKTTTTEAMLFNAGVKLIRGSVDGGTTSTDYLVQERERGVTIQSAVVSFEHENKNGNINKFNIFDTPGHADFVFEVERSLPAIDSAVIIIDNCRGVETQTKAVIRLARRHKLPILAFCNKIDKFNSNSKNTISSMENFGLNPLPVHIPLDGERVFCLLTETVIGNSMKLSEADLEIIEKYLINEEIPSNIELFGAINLAYESCKATPVLFGSSKNNLSVKELVEFQTLLGNSKKSSPLEGAPVSLAFKLTNDRRLGEVVMLRNFGSQLSSKKLRLKNLSDGGTELKGMKVYKIWGNSFEPAESVEENEVFVLAGNGKIRTGDVVGHQPVKMEQRFQNSIEARMPSCSVVLEVEKQGKEQALIKGLDILCREDPSLSYHVSEESNEIILRGLGAFHLEISISRLETEHRIKNIFQYPMRVDYREVPVQSSNILHLQTFEFQNKSYKVEFEYEIRPNGNSEKILKFRQTRLGIWSMATGLLSNPIIRPKSGELLKTDF